MTDAKSQIEEDLTRLLDQQKQILKSLADIKDIIEFRTVYQRWDTQSLKIVQTLAPDKYDEFVNYFLTNPNQKLLDASITDYVRGMGQAKDAYTDELPFDPHELARIRFSISFRSWTNCHTGLSRSWLMSKTICLRNYRTRNWKLRMH